METHKNIPVIAFASLKAWQEWLSINYSTCPAGVWILVAKKNKGVTSVTYEDVREGALCYGWIDSVLNRYDDSYYLLKLTPRRPKSIWSKINVALCEQYIADGRMQPSGLKEVQAAKADGRWDRAY